MSPLKEPGYFALKDGPTHYDGPGDMAARSMGSWMVRDLASYSRLFTGAEPGQLKGEASTNYLSHPQAASAIHDLVPKVRMFAVLRNPVDRAYSHYLLLRQQRREPLQDFAEALDKEESRLAANWLWDWGYMAAGRYVEQLRRYYELFPPEQLRVFLFEDLDADTPGVVRQMVEALGVDATFTPPNIEQRFNTAGVPRSAAVDTFLRRRNPLRSALQSVIPRPAAAKIWQVMDRGNHTAPALEVGLRRRLLERCRSDIEELADLLGRDLSHWLT